MLICVSAKSDSVLPYFIFSFVCLKQQRLENGIQSAVSYCHVSQVCFFHDIMFHYAFEISIRRVWRRLG